MSFFNKKEDVIDLQLTQYGKYLLSQGKLKPVYYAFFDDDILYDDTDSMHFDIVNQKILLYDWKLYTWISKRYDF